MFGTLIAILAAQAATEPNAQDKPCETSTPSKPSLESLTARVERLEKELAKQAVSPN
ncbi:hypothetical protein F183_A52750 [Bryobacterales bacterium F-183]|nr:hypothetical protein F183_A52750 [Bryobacterales bacterium F-183]